MLRQKIDWEKVPWLMTKVKVSEEYYVNYWRHTPFQKEWEGAEGGAREREKAREEWGTESEKRIAEPCHQRTGPQTPISCHLSSPPTSSPPILPGLHAVTKGMGAGRAVNISMIPATERFRESACEVRGEEGSFCSRGKAGWQLLVSLCGVCHETSIGCSHSSRYKLAPKILCPSPTSLGVSRYCTGHIQGLLNKGGWKVTQKGRQSQAPR